MDRRNDRRKRTASAVTDDDDVGSYGAKPFKVDHAEGNLHESDGQDDIGSVSGALGIKPQQMATIVRTLRESTGKDKKGQRKFSNFLSGYDLVELPEGVDLESFKNDIKRYYKEASLYSSVSLDAALYLLDSLLQEGRSITLDPDFPKRPPNAYQIFQKAKATTSNQKYFENISTFAAQYRDEKFAAERQAAEEEMRRLFKEYAGQLAHYKESHPNLPKEYVEYINKQISSAKKTSATDLKSPKKPGKKEKNSPKPPQKTPFELYSMSLKNKYQDLEPEKREKKLRKKFAKLDDDTRELYENLAAQL